MNDHYLTQLIKENTRLNIKTGETSLLDLVISSHPSLIGKPTIAPKISDHCLIDFIVSTTLANQTKPAYRMYQYKKGNYDAIRKDVTTFSTNFLQMSPGNNTVDKNWTLIRDMLLKSTDKHIPSKICKPNHKPE